MFLHFIFWRFYKWTIVEFWQIHCILLHSTVGRRVCSYYVKHFDFKLLYKRPEYIYDRRVLTSPLGHSSKYSEKRSGLQNNTNLANHSLTTLLCLSNMHTTSYHSPAGPLYNFKRMTVNINQSVLPFRFYANNSYPTLIGSLLCCYVNDVHTCFKRNMKYIKVHQITLLSYFVICSSYPSAITWKCFNHKEVVYSGKLQLN